MYSLVVLIILTLLCGLFLILSMLIFFSQSVLFKKILIFVFGAKLRLNQGPFVSPKFYSENLHAENLTD